MSQSSSRRMRGAALGSLVALALLVTGCSEALVDPNAATPSSSGQTGSTDLKVAVPGQLTACAGVWAPYIIKEDNGDLTGLEVDLVTKVAEKLGLKAKFEITQTASLVTSVSTGRCDVGIMDMTDTVERQAEANMVNYMQTRHRFIVKKGTTGIDGSDLCGRTVATTQGSSVVQIVEMLSKKCVDAGKPAVKNEVAADAAGTLLAVQNGRADGYLADGLVGAYQAEKTGQVEVAPGDVGTPPHLISVVTSKKNPQMGDQVRDAIQSFMDDGSYAELLAKYHGEEAAIDKATINGAH